MILDNGEDENIENNEAKALTVCVVSPLHVFGVLPFIMRMDCLFGLFTVLNWICYQLYPLTWSDVMCVRIKDINLCHVSRLYGGCLGNWG